MNKLHLRCFLAAAETLHFGRAARQLEILPASLGRHLRAFEDDLGVALFARTTRSVALTEAGTALVPDLRRLLDEMQAVEDKARRFARDSAPVLRVGAIDSASAGMLPRLVALFREQNPDVEVQLSEQKTIHLLPRLLNGGLDLAFCRPPDHRDPRIEFRTILFETPVVALPAAHPLASRPELTIPDLADAPLIVPDRRSRPHSHDLTIRLFLGAGLSARISQVAEEKHTIVNMVAAGSGLAIVPRWTARLAVPEVAFVPLHVPPGTAQSQLILAAAWPRGTRDALRTAFLDTLETALLEIEASA